MREEISGIIKGSEIFAERKLKIGNGMMVEVTITMPLNGEDSLSSVLYPEIAKRNRQASKQVPMTTRNSRPDAANSCSRRGPGPCLSSPPIPA